MAVTLRDIARHLGISHATVSFVLNNRTDMGITEATRQRVLSAAQELGYKPNRAARALTTGRTDMIAVCLPSSGDGYYASLLHHFQAAIDINPYEVVVWESQPCIQSGRKLPVDLNVDGYLALDVEQDDGIFTAESGVRKPGVNVGMVARQSWDNVRIDVEEAAAQALSHLVSQGCKKLAYVYPARSAKPRDGLYQAVSNFKAPGVTIEEIACPGKERHEAVAAIRSHVTDSGAPQAVLCHSDSLAIAAFRALTELGYKVPTDVAIVGNGGTEEAEYFSPSLSTIAHPIAEIAADAWRLLRQQLDSPAKRSQSKVHKATFLARGSSEGFGK